ncbi:MAG: outer membrane lipoprotein LolB [Burkholderiales bacterium]|nr:outer membrane lipoprotein LolB [Burkholderiales bacterium]
MMRRLLVAASLLLAACATTHLAPAAFLSLPDLYTVSGRVAVNAAGKGYNVRFGWTHEGANDRVDISNPLGQTVARIELLPDGARYYDADGKLHDSADVETLSERQLGWRLPAVGLRYWLLGMSDPSRPATWSDTADTRQLDQDGWRIQFPQPASGAPSKLVLTRPDLKVSIALYDWQLPNATHATP